MMSSLIKLKGWKSVMITFWTKGKLWKLFVRMCYYDSYDNLTLVHYLLPVWIFQVVANYFWSLNELSMLTVTL